MAFILAAVVIVAVVLIVGALVASDSDSSKTMGTGAVGSPDGGLDAAGADAGATCGDGAVGSPKTPCQVSQTPNITTVSGPDDLGCGGFKWKVWFDIPTPAGKDGWVIQEITTSFDAKNPDGSANFKKTYHYWEAWEIKAGKKVTIWQDEKKDDNDDEYSSSSRPGTKGTITYTGKAKFYEGPLPADFKTNNPDTIAGILPSTTTRPPFWDGTGTDHNISSTWDCTTTPKSSKVSGQAGSKKVEGK